MDKQTKQQALLQRLHNLSAQPQELGRYTIELLGKERGIQVVSIALEILAAAPGTEVRKVSEARMVLL